MAENVKAEALPDLDDLLQCPVCYEIPSGQIFQCNEGHHVCGRCKARLSQCPVCRALFFGTRNYAMEELIANVRKLRAFKLGGKVTTGSSGSGSNTPAEESTIGDAENDAAEEEENNLTDPNLPVLRAPPACKGLFRCLCCKNGNSIRLPAARLLNHLRYFHSPELIEGQSENGEYLQAWQFSTIPGRIVTAVRVSDMGIFFLIIEISNESVYAWLSMAAAPWVTNEFSYTVTISGNDREAIFSDCVWSVRSCEGFLKKRRRCLVVNGVDARALVAPATISGKLSVYRVRPDDVQRHLAHPRAVLRVASRGAPAPAHATAPAPAPPRDPGPLLRELQSSVARLSRAFATLDRQPDGHPAPAPLAAHQPAPPPDNTERTLSRNARRRMRQRLRATLNENQDAAERVATRNRPAQTPNGHLPVVHSIGHIVVVPAAAAAQRAAAPTSAANSNARRQNNNAPANPIRSQTGSAAVLPSPTAAARPRNQLEAALLRNVSSNSAHIVQTGLAIVQQAPSAPAPAPAGEPSGAAPQNGGRANKKKRRQRR
ncbi:uncharacterized protein isoform X2 [Choristoneura fumiferana]|uniref:uncharacterized protein isoform X2 n=1 Tax=Choristoneura fumiferana TaxID=7141 RepID=UPI003D156E72